MDAKVHKRRLLESRRTTLSYDKFTFTIQRPSEMALALMVDQHSRMLEVSHELVSKCVVGWSGVLESDLYPGGGSDPVDFDKELFRDWIEDQTDAFQAISHAVMAEIKRYRERLESTAGKSQPGSNGDATLTSGVSS